MLQVYAAGTAGFCFGVKRAVKTAMEAASKSRGPLYTLGPLVHNDQVVADLAARGIGVIKDIVEAEPKSTVIIRAHGVPPGVREEAKKKDIELIDATCPFVARAQNTARQIVASGKVAVIAGDESHPEVAGIVGWAGNAVVLSSPEEVKKLAPGDGGVGVLAQTTQSEKNFDDIANAVRERFPDANIFNTICNETSARQEEAVELAGRVEIMLVVGSRTSANTSRLAELSAATGTPTYQVERAEEVKPEWLQGKDSVGITAGASTPQWIIEEVIRRMKELDEMTEKVDGNIEECVGTDEQPGEEVVIVEAGEEEVPEPAEDQPAANEKGMDEVSGIREVKTGDIITGVVVQINQDEVLVDIGSKSEGVIPLRELSCYDVTSPHDVVKLGDKIEVFVVKAEDNEGKLVLSKDRADSEKSWTILDELLETGSPLEGTVKEVVKGGLLVDVGVRAFLPASLVERGYVEDLSRYLGQKISSRVIELNRQRKKVILSRKAILEEEYSKKRDEMLENLAVNQVVRGIVRRLTNFGAFVDIGGIDGLLHISEMAWHRINHPSEVVKVGDEVDVMVLRIDKDNEKISLGLKQVLPNPWDTVEQKYPVGSVIKATVVRLAPFGAFVQLEPGVEGLVHISHLADHHIAKPDEVVKEGEEINVKVLSVDKVEKRIRLSVRETIEKQPKPQVHTREEARPAAEENDKVTIGDLVGDIFEEKRD